MRQFAFAINSKIYVIIQKSEGVFNSTQIKFARRR